MSDYLVSFEQYKDIKEIADLIDDVRKLRMYYNTQQFESMLKHIDSITRKYFVETLLWNTTNTAKPTTVQHSYINAETFLRLKGFSMLIEKGIKVYDQLTSEELNYIASTTK